MENRTRVKSVIIGIAIALVLSCAYIYASKNEKSLETSKEGDITTEDPGMALSNVNQLDRFIDDINAKRESELRLLSNTDEGDLLITELIYDGHKIIHRYDNSRDDLAGGFRGVRDTVCTGFGKEEIETDIRYYIEGCKWKDAGSEGTGQKYYLLAFPKS